MKKNILFSFIMLSALYSKAQILENIGFKTGCSIATQTWDYKESSIHDKKNYATGFYGVITADFFKSKYFGLTTDFGFIQKGFKEIFDNSIQDRNGFISLPSSTTIGYLTFSPMLKVHYTIKAVTTYALLGPRIDYQIAFKSNYYSEPNYYKKAILGINYALGIEYRKNKIGILLEAQAQPDLTPLKSVDYLKITGNAFVISTGIRYHLN